MQKSSVSPQAREFAYQTIVDNVSLIDEEMLFQVNLLVSPQARQLKTDSYALETNVHFPTDLIRLRRRDALRKGLDMVEKLREVSEVKGWRKLKHLYRNTNLA